MKVAKCYRLSNCSFSEAFGPGRCKMRANSYRPGNTHPPRPGSSHPAPSGSRRRRLLYAGEAFAWQTLTVHPSGNKVTRVEIIT